MMKHRVREKGRRMRMQMEPCYGDTFFLREEERACSYYFL